MRRHSLESPEAIADAVRRERAIRGLTQAQLAASAGVCRKFVIELESVHPRAELAKVLSVLRALDIRVAGHPTPRS